MARQGFDISRYITAADIVSAVTAGIIQVDAAISQLTVVQIGLLGTLAGLFGYAGYLLTLLF